MSVKPFIIGLVVIALLAIGAAGAWFYYGGVPKKEPCRVRQVISIQAQQPVPAPLTEIQPCQYLQVIRHIPA